MELQLLRSLMCNKYNAIQGPTVKFSNCPPGTWMTFSSQSAHWTEVLGKGCSTAPGGFQMRSAWLPHGPSTSGSRCTLICRPVACPFFLNRSSRELHLLCQEQLRQLRQLLGSAKHRHQVRRVGPREANGAAELASPREHSWTGRLIQQSLWKMTSGWKNSRETCILEACRRGY